jgi:carbamoyltransferase
LNILAFNHGDGGHDSAAALVCDGKLVAAVEEERFSRVKHDGGTPIHAIGYCLAAAGLRMQDIDTLAFPAKPFRSGRNSGHTALTRRIAVQLLRERQLGIRAFAHKLALDCYLALGNWTPDLNWRLSPSVGAGFAEIARAFGKLPKVRYFDHHACHAAAAYLASPFDAAAIATFDGRGGWYATTTSLGRGDRVELVSGQPYKNSLGFFYRDCTTYLGLGEFGEGKMMGLAPYGDPERYRRQAEAMLEVDATGYRYRKPPNATDLGFGPRNKEPITEPPWPDFAAACQVVLERAMRTTVESILRRSESRRLCLGGGVTLNCSSNGALRASGLAESIAIFPATGDSGLPVGAALLAAAAAGELHREPLEHAYWGPEFGVADCEAALRKEPAVIYSKPAELAAEVAGHLAAGKIIGWYQGRMELGPRALGNRSILADPRTIAMRDRVNRVKRREPWRPLAPAVLEERATEYFELRGPSRFMLFACQVRPAARDRVAAIVHVDGSARPQTVAQATNPRLHQLISAFDRITGIPMVLNTSFNDAGEPIVCAPQDAVRTFLATGMDMLVLGDFVVQRADTRATS